MRRLDSGAKEGAYRHAVWDEAHLARGIHPGCVPLGLVLEVDLIPDEVGLGLVQSDLRLRVGSTLGECYGYMRTHPLCEGADLCGYFSSECRSSGSMNDLKAYLGGVEGDSLRHGEWRLR